jgi:DNA-directed RNA polymerase subunit alpha
MFIDKLISKFKKNPHLKDKIKDIGLTDRTYHCLRKAGIDTVGDLVELSRKDLKGFRRVVRLTVEEVEKVLSGMGLGLRRDE